MIVERSVSNSAIISVRYSNSEVKRIDCILLRRRKYFPENTLYFTFTRPPNTPSTNPQFPISPRRTSIREPIHRGALIPRGSGVGIDNILLQIEKGCCVGRGAGEWMWSYVIVIMLRYTKSISRVRRRPVGSTSVRDSDSVKSAPAEFLRIPEPIDWT